MGKKAGYNKSLSILASIFYGPIIWIITLSPRSLGPFGIVCYYINRVKTSWTYSNKDYTILVDSIRGWGLKGRYN